MKAEANIGVRSLCLRAGLVLGTLLFLGTSLLLPQGNSESGKDKTPGKPPDSKADKDKTPGKLPDTKADSAKTVEPSKSVPPDRTVTMSEKKFQELEKKGERKSVDFCSLTGELKDHVIFFDAEFRFETNLPTMIVPLGLQRGFLIDTNGLVRQKLAEQDLVVRGEDDSYVLEVAKPGKYVVTLHLKVPVGLRRSGEKGGIERGFVLGLPAAPTTELFLKLPQEIKELRSRRKAPDETTKELRWLDPEAEKFMQAGRWWLTPGTAKMIDVFWKERDAGAPPQANVKINVNLEESQNVVTAEMQLEDPRGEAKEWQLFVPYRTDDVKMIKAPAGVAWNIVSPPPDSKGQPYVVRFKEPTSEPFTVRAEVRLRKDPANLLVGPFYVQVPGASVSQQGSIVVQASLGRGQFLDFKPNEWVHRSEVPKGSAWQDVKATFDYGNFPPQLKPNDPKIPLEIKWRTDKGSGEASVEHLLKLKLRPAGLGLQIDVQTKINIKSLSGGDYLDVQLPRSPPKLSVFALFPAAGFPGGIPLGAFAELMPTGPLQAEPVEKFLLLDDDGATITAPDGSDKAPDASGKIRIKFAAPVTKEVTQTLVGKYFVPPGPDGVQKFLIDLPRPIGIVDRGGKVWARSEDEKIEFLMGPPRADFKTDWDTTFPPVELTWRPYHPQYLVQNIVDVKLRGKEAHLQQHLTLTWTPRPGGPEVPRTDTVALRLPRNRNSLKITGGGEEINPQSDQDIVWVKMTGTDLPLVVDFYQPLPDSSDEPWKVPLVTPEGATAVEANVRIWCEPGVQPEAEAVKGVERWQDRGPEVVRGRPFPALVLFGSGPSLDLTLRLRAVSGISLPVMVCDKGLVEASIDEDGTHRYRARYVIQKLYANRLRVRFPASVATCNPRVTLDGNPIQWEQEAERSNVAVLKIDPEIVRGLMEGKGQGAGVKLFLDYKLPANSAENGTHWQMSLTGPVFLGDVFLGRVRWLVHMPGNWVSVVAANNVHPDFRWTLQSYLLAPEPVVSAGELAEWRQGWDESLRDEPSLVFSRRSQESFAVVHFPKQTWLALCSGLLLTLGLALHLFPMSRSIFWLVLVTLTAGMIIGGFVWPAWVPAMLFGAQPGAVVLALILVTHWVLKERYRRQVIFMPGFTRLKPGSSLLHNSPVARPREASTVDAPAPAGRGSSAQHNPPG